MSKETKAVEALREELTLEAAKVEKLRAALEWIAQHEYGWSLAPAHAREVLAEVFG